MHSPFTLHKLISSEALGSEAVTAILFHANRIYLGTDKGTLLLFDLAHASTSAAPPSATFVAKHERFAKKAIDQLGVIKELNGLICLSAGDVALHALPSFDLLSSFAAQTKGAASLFALSTYVHTPIASPVKRRTLPSNAAGGRPQPTTTRSNTLAPELHTTLAIACRRRLVFLSWLDGAWRTPVELSLPHQIRGMAFDERKLVAGFSTGEVGVVSLPSLRSSALGIAEQPVLGELFRPVLPVSVSGATAGPGSNETTAGGSTGSALSGLGGVMGLSSAKLSLGGLGLGARKIDKNDVVAIPRLVQDGDGTVAGRMSQGNGVDKGKARAGVLDSDQDDTVASWLWDRSWGWEDVGTDVEGEVIVVRDNIGIPITPNGSVRKTVPSSIVYRHETDETVVVAPFVVSLLSPGSAGPGLDSTSNQSEPSRPSLSVHSIETLEPIQSLDLPPRPVSPPTSPSKSSRAREASEQNVGKGRAISARLLTAASSATQPPLLVLTATAPAPSGPALVPANNQTLWIATMKSWPDQIEELGAKGAWENAIKLLRRAGPSKGPELAPALSRKLAGLHSLALYKSDLYDLAVNAWIALNVSPAKVIALFPLAISGKLHVDAAGHEELFGGRSRRSVEATIEDDLMRKHEEEQTEQKRKEETALVASAPSSSPAGKKTPSRLLDDDVRSVRSVSGRLRGKASWLKDPSEVLDNLADRAAAEAEQQAKLEAKNYARSVDELIRYLTDRRQKYTQALAALLPSARVTPSMPRPEAAAEELLALPDGNLTALNPNQLARVAQVVDTALFRSYLATKPVMLGPLCRIENWCEVSEVEELLMEAKKYRELLDLYNGKNMHEKAIQLLRKMSEDEDDPEEKVGPTVRYLQKLGSDHLGVIFESSRWVFEVDRRAGLEIFVADLEEVESLPRHATMAHLERIGPDVCISYLEHTIHVLGENGSEFHEKLIELYLASIKETTSASDGPYRKLLDLLETSTSYRADRILGRLPSEDMHEVRAILLGRLGRHEGALQIYVYQLEDHAIAEEYCKRVYDLDPSMRSSIFHVLLRIYLRPRPNHPLLFGPALALLASHAAAIDAIEVFDLLPPLVALGDLRTYLEKTLRRSGERVRDAKMVKAIGRSAMDDAERSVINLEERRVKITGTRVCPLCHKRLGNSVIAIHSPRGEVTHYQCRERFQATLQSS